MTCGSKHHFFGYYVINPWNESQDLMLGLEVAGHEYLPKEEEKAAIDLIDTKSKKFDLTTQTNAWN